MKHKSNTGDSCGIIGAGKVGRALASVLSAQDRLEWIITRSDSSFNNIKDIPGSIPRIRSIDQVKSLPDVLILAVSDESIKEVASGLAGTFQNSLEGKLVLHCSGIVPASALDCCRCFGAITASAHPYQTFYSPLPDLLDDIAWGIETKDDYSIIAGFISSLGGKPHNLGHPSPEQKALYHASAVAVSNFMTTIFALSRQISGLAGIPAADFLPAIARTTLKNNIDAIASNDFPLTGPIARGDTNAVKTQFDALGQHPQLQKTFSLLALATAMEAALNNVITKEKLEEFRNILLK